MYDTSTISKVYLDTNYRVPSTKYLLLSTSCPNSFMNVFLFFLLSKFVFLPFDCFCFYSFVIVVVVLYSLCVLNALR